MRTTLTSLLLLLVGTAVRADMGVPWEKRVPTVAILDFGPDPNLFTVFVVCRDRVEPLKMLDQRTGRVDPLNGPYRNQPVRLCAVSRLDIIHDTNESSLEWLNRQKAVLWSLEIPVRWEQVSVANPREMTELHYRVELTLEGMRLNLTSIEGRDDWSSPLAISACVASALAAGSLFVWLGLKVFRRKRVTRITPPPT
jgi:hypothetical protein